MSKLIDKWAPVVLSTMLIVVYGILPLAICFHAESVLRERMEQSK